MLKVGRVMTRDLVAIDEFESLQKAYWLMKEYGIRHLPVVDFDRCLTGIISEGDLLLHATKKENSFKLSEKRVVEIMTKDVITCSSDCLLTRVAATLMTCKFDSLPVVDEGKLVGIITTADILDVFCVQEEMLGRSVMPLNFKERDQLGVLEP